MRTLAMWGVFHGSLLRLYGWQLKHFALELGPAKILQNQLTSNQHNNNHICLLVHMQALLKRKQAQCVMSWLIQVRSNLNFVLLLCK